MRAAWGPVLSECGGRNTAWMASSLSEYRRSVAIAVAFSGRRAHERAWPMADNSPELLECLVAPRKSGRSGFVRTGPERWRRGESEAGGRATLAGAVRTDFVASRPVQVRRGVNGDVKECGGSRHGGEGSADCSSKTCRLS